MLKSYINQRYIPGLR